MIIARVGLITGLMACFIPKSFAVPIFSKLENPWASSSANHDSLLHDIRQVVEVPWAQTYIFPEKLGWVPESELWSVNDLSQTVHLRPQAELKYSPSVNAKTISLPVSNQSWKVVSRNQHWLHLRSPNSKESPWVRSNHLMSDAFTWDNLVVLETTGLKQTPQQNSPESCKITKQTLVKFLSFHGHYAKVNACGGMGYLHLSNLLTKVHFARKVKLKDSTWHTVSRVNTNEIIDADFRPIAFSEIAAFEFDPKVRYSKTNTIVLRREPNKKSFVGTFGFSTPQKMSILQTRLQRWAQSQLKGMGTFWWDFSSSDSASDSSAKSLSNATVFSGKVFDVATSPINTSHKIASAQGIYQTLDNVNWQKIEQFGDQNFPVSISANGRIFVGPFVSEDNGQNYKPYVRWDRLLRAIGQSGLVSLSQLRIGEIQPLDRLGNKIRFTLYIGKHTVRAETADLGRSWKVIR